MSFFSKTSPPTDPLLSDKETVNTQQSKSADAQLASPFFLLQKSIQLYKNNIWTLVGYSAWMLFPFTFLFFLNELPKQTTLIITSQIIVLAIEFIFAIWINIILVLIINQLDNKTKIDFTSVQKQSVFLIKPVVHIIVLQILFILGGLILFIIPGIIAAIWLVFAQTATILDNQTGTQALHISKNLFHKRFFPILYRIIVGPLFILLTYSIILSLFFTIIGTVFGFDMIKLMTNQTIPPWINLIEFGFEIFLIPLLACYMTLLYKELKREF